MSNIKKELLNELVYTIKEHCDREDVPDGAAPGIDEVWKGTWPDGELYNIAGELVDDMVRVLRRHALEMFIGDEK